MIQMMEYIVEHYALFLGSTIVILLAIIGYYADKTNFGQGKVNNEKVNERSLEGLKLSDLTSVKNKEISEDEKLSSDSALNYNEPVHSEKTNEQFFSNNWAEQAKQEESANTSELPINFNDTKQNKIIEEINNSEEPVELKDDVDVLSNNESEVIEQKSVDNTNKADEKNVEVEQIVNKDNSSKQSFDIEFDMVLPKKDLINDNILSDIEEMELDKTKKIDLSGFAEFNDIELPEIKKSTIDDDIWKF